MSVHVSLSTDGKVRFNYRTVVSKRKLQGNTQNMLADSPKYLPVSQASEGLLPYS